MIESTPAVIAEQSAFITQGVADQAAPARPHRHSEQSEESRSLWLSAYLSPLRKPATHSSVLSPQSSPHIGVLALQGDFAEHLCRLKQLGAQAREVRLPADLDGVAGLIIPGGESTTIGKLLVRTGLDLAITARANAGMPVWGTCAGMIVLAKDIGGSGSHSGPPQPLLGLMDLSVRRNAFGSQLDSFETTLDAPAVADHPLPAIFIRAPIIERTGPAVETLARLPDGRPVAARQGHLLATAFHPELTPDPAFHRYFLALMA